jgi:hypothetical protein
MSTTHEWECFIYTTYKDGDDRGMVQLTLFYPQWFMIGVKP